MVDHFSDPIGEDRIVVEDEKSWSRIVWKGLAQLLYDPRRRRMRGHSEVDDFPSSVIDHKPGVQ
jgi:hypothetical protein